MTIKLPVSQHPTAATPVQSSPAALGTTMPAASLARSGAGHATPAARTGRRLVTLCDLAAGETARVVRVNMADTACRRRFAELGLAEGMKVTVTATGETLMLVVAGAKMAMAGRCAREIQVMRL